eukprot:g595.t1
MSDATSDAFRKLFQISPLDASGEASRGKEKVPIDDIVGGECTSVIEEFESIEQMTLATKERNDEMSSSVGKNVYTHDLDSTNIIFPPKSDTDLKFSATKFINVKNIKAEQETRHFNQELEEERRHLAVNEIIVYTLRYNLLLLGMSESIQIFWMSLEWKCMFDLWEFIYYTLTFALCSLVYIYFYKRNQREKESKRRILNISLGTKGQRLLLSDFPSLPSHTEKEKAEWLNKILHQVWPFYDKVICDKINESIKGLIQSARPHFFRRIKFQTLKFGGVPFRIEDIKIETEKDKILIDVHVRWSVHANVILAMDQICPRIFNVEESLPRLKDVCCNCTLCFVLEPFIDKFPCFGAITVSFLKLPCLRFHCHNGNTTGGKIDARLLCRFLDCFIKDTITKFMLWPCKIVVPVCHDETITGPIEDLKLHHVGILTVKVLQAKDLPAADWGGSSDPFIELQTQQERKQQTKIVPKSLNPVWKNEVHQLLIQDSKAQKLYVTAYDFDRVNLFCLFKPFDTKEFLGRAIVQLSDVFEKPGQQIEKRCDLERCGFDDSAGFVDLKLVYTPLSVMRMDNSKTGAVTIEVIRCRDLIAQDLNGASDPFVRVKIGQKLQCSQVISACLNPEFNAKFEFFDVRITNKIEILVIDRDIFSLNDPLGRLEIPLHELLTNHSSKLPGYTQKWYQLHGVAHGEIQLVLQYVPLDIFPQSLSNHHHSIPLIKALS